MVFLGLDLMTYSLRARCPVVFLITAQEQHVLSLRAIKYDSGSGRDSEMGFSEDDAITPEMARQGTDKHR